MNSKYGFGILGWISKQQSLNDEAKQLLPLWQQVKTLSADSSVTTDQIQVVYDQISSAMTSGQVQAIEVMTFSQADLQTMMTELGIQVTPNVPMGTPPSGGPMGGGQPGDQGTPGPQGTLGLQGTPGAGMPSGRRGGMNSLFIDALINLLQQRGG